MITVSEIFKSIQGEGKSIGAPSVFLRLSGCNLLCGGSRSLKTKELSDGATWRCDSIESWSQGIKYSIDKVVDKLSFLLNANDHLVITGGEPLLWADELVILLERIKALNIYTEIETNGTLSSIYKLLPYLDQINVSPKLQNSGVVSSKRVSISSLREYPMDITFYKFVVSNKVEVWEAIDTYIEPLKIPFKNVYLMPAASTRETLQQVSLEVVELAKEFGFNFSTRLHLSIWDKATGV